MYIRKSIFKIIIAAELILAYPVGARATEGNTEPCEKLETTPEMRDCVGKQLKAADAELNKVYQQLIGAIDGDKERAALRKAQHAWLGFRDASCEYEGVLHQGGTLYPVIFAGCQTSLTERRTRELKEILGREK